MGYTDSLVEEFIEESPTLSWYDQERKMDAWHNGIRGLNIRACSDDKLKMNYDICVQKGYNSEAAQLKLEGQSRGLAWANRSRRVLPILSLTDFDYAGYSFVKNNSPRDIINDCDSAPLGVKPYIIAIIYAIIAQLPNHTEIIKNEILNRSNYTKDDIKEVIQKALQDKDIVARLNEIKSFKEDLQEDIEKHDTLNPKLWNTETNTLKPEVKDKIMQIVDDFLKGLENDEIKFNLTDIKLVGSNCSYNYNKDSDLDVHLVMETGSLHCPDNLYPLLYSAYRSLYNGKLDIDFYGIPVELYVETDDTEQMSDPAQAELKEDHQQTTLTVFHSSDTDNLDFKNIDLNNSKEIGIHCGTELAARQRKHKYIYKLYLNNYNEYDCNFDIASIWSSQELVNYLDITEEEKENLINSLRKVAGDEDKYYKCSKIYRDFFLDKGYNLIKYKNEIEDKGSTSYIILDTKIVESQELIESLQEARQQTALKSNGIYSVMNDAWIKEPIAEDIPEIDKEAFNKEFKIWEDEYNRIIAESKNLIKEELVESKEEDILKARSIIADQIRGEWDADKGYTKAVADLAELKEIDTEEAQDIMLDIASEEHTHVGELETAYDAFDPHLFDELDNGHTEANENTELSKIKEDDTVDESLTESVESDQIKTIEDFIEKIYTLRQTSIATDGEYGIGNLVFKECRNKGYLDNLRDLKNKLKSKDFSLK